MDLKEGISSIIYAAPRCSELPELLRIRDIFEKKYGKDFVTAAVELRTDSGVNRHVCFQISIHFSLLSSLAFPVICNSLDGPKNIWSIPFWNQTRPKNCYLP